MLRFEKSMLNKCFGEAFSVLDVKFCFVVCLAFSLTTPSFAQPRGFAGRESNGSLLEIGSRLPAVKLLDEQGKEFSTSDLSGQYTVLVFGCLT